MKEHLHSVKLRRPVATNRTHFGAVMLDSNGGTTFGSIGGGSSSVTDVGSLVEIVILPLRARRLNVGRPLNVKKSCIVSALQ